MIICPGCKAENKDGVEACPYCGTSLVAAKKSAAAAAGTGAVSSGSAAPGLNSAANAVDSDQTGSGAQSASQVHQGVKDLSRQVELAVEKVVLGQPQNGSANVPNTTRRRLLAALGLVATGGASGFGGFRFGAGHSDAANSQDLQTKLQLLLMANQKLNTAIAELNRQLASKQAEYEKLAKKQTSSRSQETQMESSLRVTEQKLKKAQDDAASLQQQLNAERHGAKYGKIEWTGNLDKRGESLLVEINNGKAMKGSLAGALPGVPCKIYPIDVSASVVEAPNRTSPNHVVFRVYGKGKTSVRFFWEVS